MRLGHITFQDFEVGSGVTFGGRQSVVTHRLGSGKRVIDVLGPDAANIRFAGAFSGQDAVRRAQALDQIRKAGRQVELSWGNLKYKVVLSQFNASFDTKLWIPYNASCTVTQDDIQGNVTGDAAESQLAASMLSAAAALIATVAVSTVLTPRLGLADDGLADVGQASLDSAGLGQAQSALATDIIDYEGSFLATRAFQDANPASAVLALSRLENSCQGMCTLVAARSYLSVAGLTMGLS